MVEVADRSIQVKPKYEQSPGSSYVLYMSSFADDIPAWGTNVFLRDRQLREFWPTEPILASAIYTIVSRNAAFNWTLEGPPRTVKIVQDVLHEADFGKGWLSFVTKLSVDLFTTDNGAFIEVIRSGPGESDPVVGIANLDSGRCRRTGVTDWPVVYSDLNGADHRLAPWQVITIEEFPSPIERMFGVQMCAVSRVLRYAQFLKDVGVYKREKVGGNFMKAIDLVSGINRHEIDDAVEMHKAEQLNQGYQRYLKPVILSTLDPNAEVKHVRINFAELPDGFDEEQAMRWYINLLAMGFGADYQDFAPLPGGNLGTSSQSQILHMKSRGKGPALFMKMIEHKFNFHGIVPRNVTFRYDEQDVASDMEQAQLAKARAEASNLYVLNGVLTPQAVRQQMLDRQELSQEEFDALQTEPDITPDVTVSDEEQAKSKAVKPRRPDFMKAERLAEEATLEKAIQKAFAETFTEIKKRILKTKVKAIKQGELPFDDVLDDEELWQEFRVKVVGAAQPSFRKGALKAADYNASLGLAVNMDLVNRQVLDFTRTYTNAWWAGLEDTTREGLRKAMVTWQETGLGERGLPDLVDAIEPLFGEARAKRIAVTEVTRVFDEGNRLARLTAGIETEEWQTAEDEFVCTQNLGSLVPEGCAGLDGMRFSTNSGPRPVTDTHPNCRCSRLGVANDEVVE